MAFCSGEPEQSESGSHNPVAGGTTPPCRYAPSPGHKARRSSEVSITWLVIAAPSTSQPMVPMSAQLNVG